MDLRYEPGSPEPLGGLKTMMAIREDELPAARVLEDDDRIEVVTDGHERQDVTLVEVFSLSCDADRLKRRDLDHAPSSQRPHQCSGQ
jgi:hypothetical protein